MKINIIIYICLYVYLIICNCNNFDIKTRCSYLEPLIFPLFRWVQYKRYGRMVSYSLVHSFITFMTSRFNNIKFLLMCWLLFCFYIISVREKVKATHIVSQATFDISMRPSTLGSYFRYGTHDLIN